MRLFLGMLILSNVMVSILYWITSERFGGGKLGEMLVHNGIWTIFISLTSLGVWFIEPYCNI